MTTLDCFPPTVTLENVSFYDVLGSHASKLIDHPDLLRQLSLEVVDSIPAGAFVIYTDGIRLDDGRTGGGIFISNIEDENRHIIRNPDYCTVFRSEIMTIGEALNHSLTTDKNNIWILTESKTVS